MASISDISEQFCDWRAHISKGDSIQAHDGRGWFAATIYLISTEPKQEKDLLIGLCVSIQQQIEYLNDCIHLHHVQAMTTIQGTFSIKSHPSVSIHCTPCQLIRFLVFETFKTASTNHWFLEVIYLPL